jgi:hypothetical protein
MRKPRLSSSSAARRGAFLLLSVMLMLVATWKAAPTAHASGCGANVFTYMATTSNTSGYITTINSAFSNNNPNILFEVSQLYTGAYDPHPLGVWYNSLAGRWTIFNEDTQAMTIGTSFSIREQPASCTALPVWQVYLHTATASNTAGDHTVLDSIVTDYNPNAVVEVTQDYRGVYDPHEVGVYYTGSQWAIFNEDQAPMPAGAAFDLSVGQAQQTAYQNVYIHAATAANTFGHVTYPSDGEFTNPNLTPRVNQVWNANDVCGCVYNPHAVGLWYNPLAGRWSVYNVDRAPMPAGAAFFISIV